MHPRRHVAAPLVEGGRARVGGQDSDHPVVEAELVETRVDQIHERRPDAPAALVGAHRERVQLGVLTRRGEGRRPVRGLRAGQRVGDVGVAVAGDEREAARCEHVLVELTAHRPRRGIAHERRQIGRDRLVVCMELEPERLETRESAAVEWLDSHAVRCRQCP